MDKVYPPGPQGGTKSRVKNHCRKFWWCDCLVLIIVVLVIILPIIFVAIPKIAQDEINASTLEVISEEVSEPTPNGVHLKLQSVIRSNSSFHPTVDSFVAALSLEGQEPFVYIQIPETKSKAETQVYVDQYVNFTSLEAFSTYTKAVMGAETLNMHMSGKTQVHLQGLPAMDVNFNKVISVKGLNKLEGLNITSIKLLTGPQILPDGSNMIGTVSIPNPSVTTIDLGDVTMNLAIDNKPIGSARLPNLTLQPGDNSVNMQSQIDPVAVFQFVTTKYKNAIIPLEISGNSSTRNGESLPYYEAAIQSNVVKVDLDVSPALAAAGVKIGG
ncbi:hypothetical protein BDU57DRAFT_370374 [Ampelomyces quisqualis]|uniref:Uncharacterized protein n=1 Tax=Ampelomyces quisqualis TaxID=50730 RepID=A0A6A5QDP5_AMPQU|nr:hypothetical protein BDU57DRAFT_370374 [Ampelomyces quisqualis]